MKRSLQRHLTLMLGSALLLAGLIAAAASFGLAYIEAKELQDDTLRQIAALTAGYNIESVSSDVPDKKHHDSESRILVTRTPPDPKPGWLPDNITTGLHTVKTTSGELRIFVRERLPGEHIIVAQPTDVRDEIAIDSALRTLMPLLLLLPVLAWLMVRIVRRELAPITQLSKSLDAQSADQPLPLDDGGLPDEITPFVHAINRLLVRVNHLIKQQRRFIADAAHELRSPLTALSVQSQNLQKSDSLATMHERILPLHAGIERARQLTEQLLSLARTQSGEMQSSAVNLSVLGRELIAEFLPIAETKDIDLGLEELAHISLQTSPEGLRLILKNALENALKYTPAAGEITLRILSENGNAIIEVVDSGPGIPLPELEHVFEAFYRIPATPGSGSGLGLAIARESAMRMNGTVSLHERPGVSGLVFRYCQTMHT